jgi:thioredoxin 1
MVVNVTDQTFEEEVIKSTQPALVDLWAPWCGPCRIVGPVVESLSEKYKGKFKFCKINVDENQKIAASYNVMSIPTLIFFKDGKAVDTVIGAVPETVLQQKIDKLLQ